MIRTDTECDKCAHKNICRRLDMPERAIDDIADDNDLNIIVSCIHFQKDREIARSEVYPSNHFV